MDRDAGRGVPGDWEALGSALPGYELLGVLGRGAFAVVYSARHVRLDRDVAIKRLSPDLLSDDDARRRFVAEAQVLASLDHPHVVRVHDYVESDDVCALVMEHLHGGTLAERSRVARLPEATACAIAIAALYGLEHAHQHGVLHRDIKPENLLFSSGDLVKVADFGIAKVLGAGGLRLTATSGTLGTPAYMAPEQVVRSAGALGPATDVWGLGAVLYELLAGSPPFATDPTDEFGDVLFRRVNEDAPPLSEVAPQVPEPIAAAVMTSVARDPQARFATAAAFAGALEHAVSASLGPSALRETQIQIHRTDPARVSTPTVAPPRPGNEQPTGTLGGSGARAGTRPRRRVLAGLAAALVAAVVITIVIAAGGGSGPSSALANLPTPPVAWPSKFSFGYMDQVRPAGQVAARLGRGGMIYADYGGDAAAKQDWSHTLPPDKSPQAFATAAVRAGLIPFLDYYEIDAIGRYGKDDSNNDEVRRTFLNKRLMIDYWENVRHFLQEAARANGPVVVNVECNFFGLMEQNLALNSEEPNQVPVDVSNTGLADLQGAGFPNDLSGFSNAWGQLRDKYAPKVLLGPCLDFYGAGSTYDLGFTRPAPQDVIAGADSQAKFFLNLSSNSAWDYIGIQDSTNGEQGSTPNAPFPTDPYRAQMIPWIKRLVHLTGRRVILDNIPLGNTVMKTIDDKAWHYHDHWVQWLMGDALFTNVRKLLDAGVMGIMFEDGGGSGDTCPCDAAHDGVTNGGKTGRVATSADDDGGYFEMRIQAIRKAGGLPLT